MQNSLIKFVLATVSLGLLWHQPSLAELLSTQEQPLVLAQASDANDAYDPFVDYSEFDENSDEEADINFFKHGRFFTLGFTLGQRAFTQGLRSIYQDGQFFGLFLSYFFDLRFALQLSYTSGSHPIGFTAASTSVTGDSTIRNIGLSIKYFLNTQNVTRGLASLNPYIIGGFSQLSRETAVDGQPAFGKDGATGFEIGAGIEVPILRNKMYLGLQGTYEMASFPGENSELLVDTGSGLSPSGLFPNGDMIHINAVVGVNF